MGRSKDIVINCHLPLPVNRNAYNVRLIKVLSSKTSSSEELKFAGSLLYDSMITEHKLQLYVASVNFYILSINSKRDTVRGIPFTILFFS
jgi:hypothetical protein